MPETALWLAALVACVPAIMGNRTACALLASLAYAAILERLAIPFGPVWMLADLAVLAIILRPNMTLQDELIAALFVPAWVGYALDAETNYTIGMFVVTMQLLICVPWIWLQKGGGDVSHGPRQKGGACAL